jgi:3-(3-hydroxy-phenyl)propionate hydroxylase
MISHSGKAPQGPVVVIGGGPSGMTLANLLGFAGIDVLLIERNPGTSDLPRAVSFDDESLRTFQACGLEKEAYDLIMPGTGTKYYGAAGKLLAYQRGPAHPRFGHPVKNPFSQPQFERMLRRGLERFANVEARFSTELIDLQIDEHQMAHLTISDAMGTRTHLTSSIVVGCDGGRSTVRDLLGVKMIGTSLADPWLVIDVLEDQHDERYAMHHCDPQRPYVIVAGRDGRCRYEFRLLPHEDPEQFTDLPAISRLLAPFRTIAPDQIERCTVYTFHALLAERWRDGPVMLAGDAAHMMPPFAGQGLNSGIRDAHNLAWKIAAVIRGSAQDDLLDTYELERRPHAEATVALSVRLGQVMMSRHRTLARVRDTALRAALVVPAFRRYVTEGRFKPAPYYRSGAVVSAAGVSAVVGRPLPQPLVLLANGEQHRLDDVLGPGFALIRVDPPSGAPTLPVSEEPWNTLAPRVVNLLLGDRAPRTSTDGEIVVADIDGSLTSLLGPFRGQLLLIRPDRFVAAASPADAATFGDLVADAFCLIPGSGRSAPSQNGSGTVITTLDGAKGTY